jgi:hypothetical protein
MTAASFNPEYFELPELPGQPHFRCKILNASLSTASCAGRWSTAASAGSDTTRWIMCKGCPVGGRHAGRTSLNCSPFAGRSICGRCHAGATRLIFKHLCISCYNRQREQMIGKNRKGAAPIKLAPLHRRSISYMAGGKLRTKTIDRSINTTELVVAVLRDEEHAVQFRWQAPPSLQALLRLEEIEV